MRKHESYHTYYTRSRFSVYLSKGMFWVLLDVVSAAFMALFIWGFFWFLSILA